MCALSVAGTLRSRRAAPTWAATTRPTGLATGPCTTSRKYSMSTAYLATAHFKDQDALSARIIQARFTGHFRFACQAFLEFMSDPTTSGAGSNNPELSAFGNPDDFTSQYDRNWLAMASALFAESYFTRDGAHLPHGRARLLAGELRGARRAPLGRADRPLAEDSQVYGEEDLFRTTCPCTATRRCAPLDRCASCATWHRAATARASARTTPTVADQDQFHKGRRPQANSLQSLYRERIVQPHVQVQHQRRHRQPAHRQQRARTARHQLHQRRLQGQAAAVRHVGAQRHARRVGHPPAAPRGLRPEHRERRLRPDQRAHLLRLEPVELGLRDVLAARMRSSNQHHAHRTHTHARQTHPFPPDCACAATPTCAGLAPAALPQGVHVTACSANKGQTCKSQINRATVGDNFDFATQVAEQFRTEQMERYKDHLATKLRARAAAGLDQPAWPAQALRVARRRLRPGRHDLGHGGRPDLVEAGADRYWGLSREEAALRFDLIRQQLKPGYITS